MHETNRVASRMRRYSRIRVLIDISGSHGIIYMYMMLFNSIVGYLSEISNI
jgi:hypothetical protein